MSGRPLVGADGSVARYLTDEHELFEVHAVRGWGRVVRASGDRHAVGDRVFAEALVSVAQEAATAAWFPREELEALRVVVPAEDFDTAVWLMLKGERMPPGFERFGGRVRGRP
jgi:hypothetical protein